MQRSKALALIALIGMLVVGGAVGFTLDRLVNNSCTTVSRRYVDVLAERLVLSSAQRTAVDSILDKRHRDLSVAFTPVRPQLDSIRLAARAEIFKVLDSPQRARFQQMIDESQRDQEKHR